MIAATLGALSLLALLGLRHRLGMLPIPLWEVARKAIWLGRVALPAWGGDRFDAATTAVAIECLLVVPIAAVIPWDHVFRTYVKAVGKPWRRASRR